MKYKLQNSIAGLILAGGKSTRMGQDKALLTKPTPKIRIGSKTSKEIRDIPLLTYVCTVAQDCFDCVYVIAPWVDKYRTILPQEVQLIQETITITNADSNCPLIGFYQGLQQIDSEWIMLLACDLPNLTSEAIAEWVKFIPDVAESEIALLPRGIKGWEPLCGFYRRSCLPSLEDYLSGGGKSFQKWLDRHPVKELLIDDRSILFNCNTWNDWQKVIG